ncbi:hypothetical protein Emag_005049 [Eimeria magna]
MGAGRPLAGAAPHKFNRNLGSRSPQHLTAKCLSLLFNLAASVALHHTRWANSPSRHHLLYGTNPLLSLQRAHFAPEPFLSRHVPSTSKASENAQPGAQGAAFRAALSAKTPVPLLATAETGEAPLTSGLPPA